MRTIIDVPDSEIQALDRIGADLQRSRASLIREAVAEYLAKRSPDLDPDVFGMWKDLGTDAVDTQRTLRDEWS